MIRGLLLLAAVVVVVLRAGPSTATALTIDRVGAVRDVAGFQFPPLTPPPYPEVPPWVIYHHGSYRYFVSTDHTYECLSPDALLRSLVGCRGDRTRLVTEAEADRFANPAAIPRDTDYKRTYEGVYSAQLIGGTLVGLDHAENGNEIRSEQIGGRTLAVRYHNTIQPHDTRCWGGFTGGAYRNCDWDYNAFVNSSTAPAAPATAPWRDHGPIVWPRNGYVRSSGAKASWGVRHPYGIVWRGYLYVFYFDTGNARRNPSGLPTQGVGAGIAVARSPARALGRPGTFDTWGGRRGWRPALPHGFRVPDVARYFDRPGGPSVPVLGRGRGSYYFAVTRIATRSRWHFLGLEHYSVAHSRSCSGRGATLQDALWESNDLINWHHRTTIPGLTSCGANQHVAYNNSRLHFPHFLDASGTREDAIAPASFYLIGTGANGVTLVHMSVKP